MSQQSKRIAIAGIFMLGLCLGVWFLLMPTSNSEIAVQPSFYFWESDRAELTNTEKEILKQQEVRKLYVKFFEVDKTDANGIIPVSKSEFSLKDGATSITEIVPTIYIKNNVFKDVEDEELLKLVDNLIHLVDKRFSEHYQNFNDYKELQIDCDWTLSTRKNYHFFLRELKKKLKVQLSATLRLYPYKFPDKMGVLPVDRAMLMCYNLLPPLESGDRNSILDTDELSKYVVGAKPYPIPLDLALPVFNNVLVYKNNHFNRMLHVNPDNLDGYVRKVKEPWYVVQKDTVIESVYLRQGDQLKVEKIERKRYKQALKLIRENVTFNAELTLALFYLNEQQLHSYDQKTLRTFFTDFSK